jgi:hypothetical protein
MGYSIWKPWVVTKLSTITGLSVYAHATDINNYPAAIVKTGPSEPNTDRETNRRIFRTYEVEIELIVAANPELQDADDVERIFFEKLDAIIDLFDAVANRHPGDNVASRQRLVRAEPRDSVNPAAKRTAVISLEFYKLNG